eukprot:CAMPEP_0175105386 /NCGR_PEP_ID=MMETSP0086_2-20121207/10419_1 /TAXON_ID=136419 /ORGANISM="Unknown Unknown, Strain D1" /LENGTH=245 /DNA_ID=CAMNT_0016381213 /DNA_START=143 /DNA_END=880 /DNA_ORIENTATION=-
MKTEGFATPVVPDGITKSAENFYKNLESTLSNSPARNSVESKESKSEIDTELKPTKPSNVYASHLQEASKQSAIFLCTSAPLSQQNTCNDDTTSIDDADEEKQVYVAVMDVNDDEWWEIIDPSAEDLNPVSQFDPNQDPDSDEDFVVVDEENVSQAMSEFVATALTGFPETQALTPEQLKKMLNGTFSVLAEKGKIAKAYEWGTFAYSTYKWGAYAWHLYSEPGMIKMVASGIMTAGGYLAFFLL